MGLIVFLNIIFFDISISCEGFQTGYDRKGCVESIHCSSNSCTLCFFLQAPCEFTSAIYSRKQLFLSLFFFFSLFPTRRDCVS
ncbi:MAG: hypothetical protein DWH80_09115 [Planctomycetota bacterium]|nr:MAG: hypothetical protein DWH80_09115 [Planctomycetota bacterium]